MTDLGTIRSTRRTRRTLRPELVTAPGPAVMGQPGGGSLGELYGQRWAISWGQDAPQLLHQVGDGWQAITPGAPWPDLAGAAHLSLAFDQSAHHVLGWQSAAGLRVRQWDTASQAYVYFGPFEGVDPCLMADAPLSGDVAGSDVVLWHLTPDRSALVYRLQRDYYRTVYPVAAELAPGAVLDQVVSLPLRAELLGELPSGETWAVLTSLYPLMVAELAHGAAQPRGGAYLPAVGVVSAIEPPMYGAASPGGGRYQAVVITSSTTEPPMYGAASPGGGRYQPVVITSSAAEPPMYGAAAPRPGRLALALIRYTPPIEPPMYGSARPINGSYYK